MSDKQYRPVKEMLQDTNIIGPTEFREETMFVLNSMADSIVRTLGPGAGLTFIANLKNDGVPAYPSKDGFNIVHEFRFNDQTKFFIGEFIKDMSKRMNQTVGDSTTTPIVIARDMYKNLLDLVDDREFLDTIGSNISPIALNTVLSEIKSHIIEELNKDVNKCIIKNINRDIQNKYIEKIAKVSANNDPQISKFVSDLFVNRESDYVHITTVVGLDDDTVVDKEVGFEFGTGIADDIYANMTDRITCKFENPRFLLVDGPLTGEDIDELDKYIQYVNVNCGKPIIIIAKDFDSIIRNSMVTRCTEYVAYDEQGAPFVHKKEPIALLTMDTSYEGSRERMDDLRVLLGAQVLDTRKGKILEFKNNTPFVETILGDAKEYKGNRISSRIKTGKGDKTVINERLQHLETRLKEAMANVDILNMANVENIKKRIAMINSDMTVIRVGGSMDKERRSNQMIYDDAICACQSAIKHGITLGGNVCVPFVINRNFSEFVDKITTSIVEKKLNVVYGNDIETVKMIVSRLCIIINESFKSGYLNVINNMVGKDSLAYTDISTTVYDNSDEYPRIIDLMTANVYGIDDIDANPIVPGNTDIEVLNSVFGVIGTLISCNQMLNVYPGDATLYGANK